MGHPGWDRCLLLLQGLPPPDPRATPDGSCSHHHSPPGCALTWAECSPSELPCPDPCSVLLQLLRSRLLTFTAPLQSIQGHGSPASAFHKSCWWWWGAELEEDSRKSPCVVPGTTSFHLLNLLLNPFCHTCCHLPEARVFMRSPGADWFLLIFCQLAGCVCSYLTPIRGHTFRFFPRVLLSG